MSSKFPVVAVTGSSGAGTTTVRHAFQDIFRREGIAGSFVEGNAFLRYDGKETERIIREAQSQGKDLSHFGPELNQFERLEALFREYSERGTGEVRHYVTDWEQEQFGLPAGTFTPWRQIPADTEVLFYEGMHGGVVATTWTRRKMSPSHNPHVIERRKAHDGNNGVDVAQYVDLLIGVVPVVNLEWIQKIHRDTSIKGYSPEAVTNTILRRMRDYTHYITPQFSLSDINFQRVPVVDTSNPFIARDIPTADESFLVIRFRDPRGIDFPYLLNMLHDSFMSRPNTIVCPGGKMGLAMQLIFTPMIWRLMERRKQALGR